MDTSDDGIVPASIVNAGVDWLTATAYRTRECETFYETAQTLLEESASIGNEVSTWKAGGYHGRRAAGVAVGVRNDTWIVRLSSDDARESWRRVYPLASNVSRLDVQVTFRLPQRDETFITRQRARALATNNKRGRRSDLKLISSTLDGDSIYLGKRTSDVYARCYDKGREEKSERSGIVIRQELEYKRERARSAASMLYQSASDEIESRQLVSSYFKRAGFQTMPNEAEREVGARGRTTTIDAKLGWLSQAIRPSISFLLAQGRLSDTLRALGLDEHVQPRLISPDDDPTEV
jgi:hypothetical protein